MLIHVHDPLYKTLLRHQQETGECFKLKTFDAPTSVENLAQMLFTEIRNFGFDLQLIEIQETDSSIVAYTYDDWVRETSQK